MMQRYISAEQSIAAAGAVFACMDEDYSDIASAGQAARKAEAFWSFDEVVAFISASFMKLMKKLGLKAV